MERLDEIKKELSQIDLAIAELCFAQKREEGYKILKAKADNLREEMKFLLLNKIATDDEIDIYEAVNERNIKYYRITLHNIPKEIGYIKVSYGACCIPRYGHIGYEINEKYRGNNYALRALEMLCEEMLSRGLSKPTLAAFPNNIPSITTIEKFGGELIYEAKNKFDWNIYEVDLVKRKELRIKKK